MSFGGSEDSTYKQTMATSQATMDASNAAATGAATDNLDFVKDFFDTYIKPSIAKVNAAADVATARTNELYGLQLGQAKDREKTYQTEGKAAVTDFMDTARDFSTEGYAEQQAGLALGDVNNQAQIAEQTRQRQLEARGINPTSGAAIASMDTMRTKTALVKAAESIRARKAATELGLNLKNTAANIGMEQSKYSTPMLAQAGSLASQGAGIPNAALQTTADAGRPVSAGYGLVADVAGANAGRAQNLYQSSLEAKSRSDAAESEGWGNLAGTVIGIGAKAYGLKV